MTNLILFFLLLLTITHSNANTHTTFPLCNLPTFGSHTFPASPSSCKILSQIVVTTKLIVNGATSTALGATTISGADKSPLFLLRGANLTLVDIILEHGKNTQDGGAIIIEGGDNHLNSHAFLLRTKIKSCVSLKNGGAVFIRSSVGKGKAELVLMNSILESNQATRNGGAIYASGTNAGVTITSIASTYQHNVATLGDGGAIYSVDETALSTLSSNQDTFFRNNATIGSGGAIAAFGTKVTLQASNCSENNAVLGGGGCILFDSLAVSIDENSWTALAPALINGSIVNNNHAGYSHNIGTPPVSIQVDVMLSTGTLSKMVIATAQNGLEPVYPVVSAKVVDLYGNHVVGEYAEHIKIHVDIPAENIKGTDADVFVSGSFVESIKRKHFEEGNRFTAKFSMLKVGGSPNSGPHTFRFQASYFPLDLRMERKLFLQSDHVDIPVMIKSCVGQWYGAKNCAICPVNSLRVSSAPPVENACHCNENYYGSLQSQEPACVCQTSWEYTVGSVSKMYQGCVETPDWVGATWCWVKGTDCSDQSISSIDKYKGFGWRVCDDEKDLTQIMSCHKCPTQSTSPPGSNTIQNCTCYTGLFKNKITKECESCPINSVLRSDYIKGTVGLDDSECLCNANYFKTIIDTNMVCTQCPPNAQLIGAIGPMAVACACNENFYGEMNTDKLQCVKCLGEKTSSAGSMECQCKKTSHYLSNPDIGTCATCPKEADCSLKHGMVLSELSAKPGYWKSNTNAFGLCSQGLRGNRLEEIGQERCCPLIDSNSICKYLNGTSNTDAQCIVGYAGPLCLLCQAGYIHSGGECVACPGGAQFFSALIPMLIIGILICIITLILFKCGHHHEKDATKIRKGHKFTGQIKILLSFLQIFSSMPGVLDTVAFPVLFLGVSSFFTLLNFDIGTIFSASSCSLAVSFYSRFIIHMMLLPICLLAVVLAYFITVTCMHSAGPAQDQHRKEEMSKIIIMLTLTLFPGISTKGECKKEVVPILNVISERELYTPK